MKQLLILLVFLLSCILAACPNGCSHVGLCLSDNTCQCPTGRSGSDCSQTANVHPKTPAQCPTCYITEVGPPDLYFGPALSYPDNPKVVVNYNGILAGYYANGNTYSLSYGNSTEQFVVSPYNSVALAETSNNPSAFDGCGAWMNVAISKGTQVLGFYHGEGVPVANSNCNQGHQKNIGMAYSNDGGKTFIKPANNVIITSTAPYPGVWSGVGDHGGAYWNGYFYIWYSNADKHSVGVARSSTGFPGTWFKYYQGSFSSPGVGGDDSPINAAGQGATVYSPTNSLLLIGGEYRFNSPNFFGANMAASDDGINFVYVGYPLVYMDKENFGCYGASCKEQTWYFVPVGNTGSNYVDDSFWLYYLYSFPYVGLYARYEVRHAVRLTYTTSNTTVQTRTAVTTYTNSFSGERWDASHLVPGTYVAQTILGYSATYAFSGTTLIVDCYDSANDDHFATADSACSFKRYRPIGFFFNNAVDSSVKIFSCSQTLSNGKLDRFMSTSSTCEGKTVVGSLGYLLTGSPLSSYFSTVLSRNSAWKYSSSGPTGWNSSSFSDASWTSATAPFGGSRYTSFATSLIPLPFPTPSVYYFRRTFTIPAGSSIRLVYLFLACDNWATVYFNGVQVDTESKTHGAAQYWNRFINIPLSLVTIGGSNLVAVALTGNDNTGWYFYDAEVKVYYTASTISPTSTPTTTPTTSTTASTSTPTPTATPKPTSAATPAPTSTGTQAPTTRPTTAPTSAPCAAYQSSFASLSASDSILDNQVIDQGYSAFVASQTSVSNGYLSFTVSNVGCSSSCYGAPYKIGGWQHNENFKYGTYNFTAQGPSTIGTALIMKAVSESGNWNGARIFLQGNTKTRIMFDTWVNNNQYNLGPFNLGFDHSTGYHTYSFTYTSTAFYFYVDGVYVATSTNAPVGASIQISASYEAHPSWWGNLSYVSPATVYITSAQYRACPSSTPAPTSSPSSSSSSSSSGPCGNSGTCTGYQSSFSTSGSYDSIMSGYTADEQYTGFVASQTSIGNGYLALTISNVGCPSSCYGGTYKTGGWTRNQNFGYGSYSFTAQGPTASGTALIVRGINNPGGAWNGARFMLMGYKPNQIFIDVFVSGARSFSGFYNIGFNHSKGLHTYSFTYSNSGLNFYVDGNFIASTSTLPAGLNNIQMAATFETHPTWWGAVSYPGPTTVYLSMAQFKC